MVLAKVVNQVLLVLLMIMLILVNIVILVNMVNLVILLILVIVSESCGCGKSGEFGCLGDSFDFGKLVYSRKSVYLGESANYGDCV